MLFGRLPGYGLPGSTNLLTTLPSYTTAVTQYLDRFGPYRLQPYPLPAFPDFSLYQPPPVPVVPGRLSGPRALQPRRMQQAQRSLDHGGKGKGPGLHGRSGRSSGTATRGGGFDGVDV